MPHSRRFVVVSAESRTREKVFLRSASRRRDLKQIKLTTDQSAAVINCQCFMIQKDERSSTILQLFSLMVRRADGVELPSTENFPGFGIASITKRGPERNFIKVEHSHNHLTICQPIRGGFRADRAMATVMRSAAEYFFYDSLTEL
jgi:hypothetical protein